MRFFVIILLLSLGASTAEAKSKPGRFIIKGDGTVYDSATKLTWQSEVVETLPKSAGQILCAANAKKLPGTGWRLPTVVELLSIVDASEYQGIDPAVFPNTPDDQYMTATSVASVATVWGVVFAWTWGGTSGYSVSSNTASLRCVR